MALYVGVKEGSHYVKGPIEMNSLDSDDYEKWFLRRVTTISMDWVVRKLRGGGSFCYQLVI